MPDVSYKEVALGSYTVSLANIARIYETLASVVSEQADIDLARWVKQPNQSDEVFAASKTDARERAYKVTATVQYADGSSSFGSSPDLFRKDPQGPLIAMIYMTNATAFRAAANMDPRNKFNLWLDFSQPPLLDANSFVSGPTANSSALKIEGDRAGWIAGVEKAVVERIDSRHNLRRLLHGHFAYDYGMLAFGAPFSLYLSWLAVSLQEVVHSAPTEKAEVVEASVILGGPNEHSQECPSDAAASRGDGPRGC